MPERALASIEDVHTREALLDVRSELFSSLTKVSDKLTEASVVAARTQAMLERQTALFETYADGRRQWEESATRFLQEDKISLAKHVDSDDEFKEAISKKVDDKFDALDSKIEGVEQRLTDKISGVWKWLIGVLLGVSGAAVLGIASLVYQALFKR